MMRVLVRVDASSLLGAGHVMRCLALAGELKRRGHPVVFVMRPLAGHLMTETRAAGFEVLALPGLQLSGSGSQIDWIEMARSLDVQRLDASETLALLPHRFWDWMLVDHYALGLEWQRAMVGVAQKLLAVEDQADRPLRCDILLNQNAGATVTRYADLIPSGCLSLMGPHYALLRPEFSETVNAAPRRGQVSAAPRVLVSLGGADPHGLALQVLQALADCGLRGRDVTLVAGVQNPHAQALQQRCQALGYIFCKSTQAMAQLMAQADWAVGAGGVSLLERCAMGLPSITLPIASNQQPGVAAAQARGAVLAIDPLAPGFAIHLREAIQDFLATPERLQAMTQAALGVCDGKGAARVADALQVGALALRAATLDDAAALHAWRNAPETRVHSGDGLAITLEQHQQWMQGVMASPAQRLWIAFAASGPIGVLRFDSSPYGTGTTAEISVYRVPGQPGRGWGRALIARGVQEAQHAWPSLMRVDARISSDNLASLGAFTACGFEASAAHGLYQKNIERPRS